MSKQVYLKIDCEDHLDESSIMEALFGYFMGRDVIDVTVTDVYQEELEGE